MQRKRQQPSILTPQMLAEELGLTLSKADELMRSPDFPASEIADGCFVVARTALEKWVYKKRRNTDSWFDFTDLFP